MDDGENARETLVETSVLVIGKGGHWFRLGGEPRVDLSRWSAPCLILEALAHAHSQKAGPLNLASLCAAGWPGQSLVPKARRDRVYQAISMLRKSGLKALIMRSRLGYQLVPNVCVVIADEEPLAGGP